MLFGMAHVFGTTGSIDFGEIAASLKNMDAAQSAILLPAFLLFFAGIGYKIACVLFICGRQMCTRITYSSNSIFAMVPKLQESQFY